MIVRRDCSALGRLKEDESPGVIPETNVLPFSHRSPLDIILSKRKVIDLLQTITFSFCLRPKAVFLRWEMSMRPWSWTECPTSSGWQA